MVERLRYAIEKARENRGAALTGQAAAPADGAVGRDGAPAPAIWNALPEFMPDEARMARERIVTRKKTHAAHAPFDVLRTRLIKICRTKGWSRIGITSPTKGCGKSVVSFNLAFSVARQPDMRGALLDLDLRAPRLSRLVGFAGENRIARLLRREATVEQSFVRIGHNLAVAFNAASEQNASEILQGAVTAEALAAAQRALAPDLVIYDLPPMLVVDDAIGFLSNLDGVLIVIAAGQTLASHVAECERLIGDGTNFLGVILNKQAEGFDDAYAYEYRDD